MKAIIVDDIHQYVEQIEILIPENFEKQKAYSLREAMEKFEKERFDLAIIDVRLVEKDEQNKEGLILLEWVKKNYPQTKVIMISAYKEFEFRMESFEKGADFFLEKPIDPEILKEAIKRCFEG